MHQNAFGGWAPPGPSRGCYRAPPDPVAELWGGEGEYGREGEREEEGRRGKGRKVRGGREGVGLQPPKWKPALSLGHAAKTLS